MRCPNCQSEYREGASFCGVCGASLAGQPTPSTSDGIVCQHCGSVVPQGFRYCDTCGQAMPSADPVEQYGSGGAPAATPAAWPPSRGGDVAPLPQSFGDGRYKVMGLIGEGAKKLVYLAHDERLSRDVALGVIKASLGETDLIRIRREATAMAQLSDHPHIVPVYDTGEEKGHPFIVSQFMRGGDVDSMLRRRSDRRLPVSEAVVLASQVCEALYHAHERGIIHRDVKPSNVWLTEEGSSKLGDFGLAIVQDQSRITRVGIMIGTATYMSPECAAGGARAADARSDIYSVGVMLFEMIAGRAPFEGDMVQVIFQHRNTPAPLLVEYAPDAPPELSDLISRLMIKDPSMRPSNAWDVRNELLQFA